MGKFDYSEHLTKLQLQSLIHRRLIIDLVLTYNGLLDIDCDEILHTDPVYIYFFNICF